MSFVSGKTSVDALLSQFKSNSTGGLNIPLTPAVTVTCSLIAGAKLLTVIVTVNALGVGVGGGGVGVEVGPGVGALVGVGVIVGVTPGGRVGAGVIVGVDVGAEQPLGSHRSVKPKLQYLCHVGPSLDGQVPQRSQDSGGVGVMVGVGVGVLVGVGTKQVGSNAH